MRYAPLVWRTRLVCEGAEEVWGRAPLDLCLFKEGEAPLGYYRACLPPALNRFALCCTSRG